MVSVPNSKTAKPNYNLDGGKTFNYVAPTANKNYYNTCSWDEYVCKNGTFTKLTNSAKISFTNNFVKPADSNPTKGVQNNYWYTRSGYALSASVNVKANVTSADVNILSNSCTPVQVAMSYYPEFNYDTAVNKYDVLILNKKDNISEFIFPVVQNAGASENKHYIPVWYPDGNYIVQTFVSDMWTPAGKLTYLGDSNTIKIQGSLFDDYNTGERSA